jgi:GxxExxY protein
MKSFKKINLEEVNKITGIVVDASMDVHSAMGPGLLENVYEHCLVRDLEFRGLKV